MKLLRLRMQIIRFHFGDNELLFLKIDVKCAWLNVSQKMSMNALNVNRLVKSAIHCLECQILIYFNFSPLGFFFVNRATTRNETENHKLRQISSSLDYVYQKKRRTSTVKWSRGGKEFTSKRKEVNKQKYEKSACKNLSLRRAEILKFFFFSFYFFFVRSGDNWWHVILSLSVSLPLTMMMTNIAKQQRKFR